MPHSAQARKRLRQNAKRTITNRAAASRMKTEIKKVLSSVAEGRVEDAKAALPNAMKRIDKAAKNNVIHKNTASRKKSRLARAINTASTAAS